MERVAIVGSRKGVDDKAVESFVATLYAHEPRSMVISGGANGVDKAAEQAAINLGMNVVSYRPVEHADGKWSIRCYEFNRIKPGALYSARSIDVPTWADFSSAAFFRNMLIVDHATRVVSFHHASSPGTAFTKAYAESRGVPVYEMVEPVR